MLMVHADAVKWWLRSYCANSGGA